MSLKQICWRLFCCKRKPENWIDQLESQYKKETVDMKRKEELLVLDLDLDTDTVKIVV